MGEFWFWVLEHMRDVFRADLILHFFLQGSSPFSFISVWNSRSCILSSLFFNRTFLLSYPLRTGFLLFSSDLSSCAAVLTWSILLCSWRHILLFLMLILTI